MKPTSLLCCAAFLLSMPAVGAEGTGAASEAPFGATTFRALDVNRDGVLTFSEAFANPRLSNNFRIIDANADDLLSAEEVAAVVR